MKKTIIIILVLVNLILITGGVTGYYLSETFPFSPEDKYFAFQKTAEQIRFHLTRSEKIKMQYAYRLADRRLVDLARADSPGTVETSIAEFNAVLSDLLAIPGIGSTEQALGLNRDLGGLLLQADIVLTSIDSKSKMLADLRADLDLLLANLETPEVVSMLPESIPPAFIDAEVIPFLDEDVDHSVYPLDGAHAEADCLLCHYYGQYGGTPTECEDCHSVAKQRQEIGDGIYLALSPVDAFSLSYLYPSHFEGACVDCHDTNSWDAIAFDHQGVFECKSCHINDAPSLESDAFEKHRSYSSQCVLCHSNTESWSDFEFTHSGVYECISCHRTDTPEDHYDGACNRCHMDEEDWNELEFDHIGYTECADCHQPLESHYEGACTDCHSNTNSWLLYSFNHAGLTDCVSCHERPQLHYSGQCSSCHFLSSWEKISVDHSKYPNCSNCHSSPDAHYPGNCSTCHNSNTWGITSLKHIDLVDCTTCHQTPQETDHYSNSCDKCHNTANWLNINVDHSNFPECLNCHGDDSPTNHYENICSKCHNTSNWSGAIFDHTDYTDCRSCHKAVADHYDGQCSNCHQTASWTLITFDHSGYVDCVACHTAASDHYDGQCSNCHVVSSWLDAVFDHMGDDNCESCHTPPDGHWPGDCDRCHISTNTWTNIVFDHTTNTYNDCKSCHSNDRPSNHSKGQCSKCHTTSSWSSSTDQSEIPQVDKEPDRDAPKDKPKSDDKLPEPDR